MLFVDTTPLQVVQICITSVFGLFGIAAALNGFLYRPIPFVLRLVLIAGGLCMLIPEAITDYIGLAVVIAIILVQRAGAKKQVPEGPEL